MRGNHDWQALRGGANRTAMSKDPPAHIRLLNLLGAIRNLTPFNVMTAEEDELLRALLVRWHAQEAVAVSEIMRSLAGVSQTTAYRRLIALRDKGMVRLRVDSADKRVKFVEPTGMAEEYAHRVVDALGQVAQPLGRA